MFYTDTAISLKELNVFFECSEELSHQFPFKAELHQLMAVTGIRKAEALKLKKEYCNFEEGLGCSWKLNFGMKNLEVRC